MTTWERKNVPAFDFDKSLVAMFEEVVTRFPSARALNPMNGSRAIGS